MSEGLDVIAMRERLEKYVKPRTATREISMALAVEKLLKVDTEDEQGERNG